MSTGIVGNRWISLSIWILACCLCAVNGQAGTVTWGAGNGAGGGAGVGAWSNAQTGGMHPPGSLGSNDPQYSYGYAGVDSRGPYGGAGGNGGYYVSGTDEHGRPFSYNGGGQIPPPGYAGRNDYPGGYGGYRGGASINSAATSLGVAFSVVLSTMMLGRRP